MYQMHALEEKTTISLLGVYISDSVCSPLFPMRTHVDAYSPESPTWILTESCLLPFSAGTLTLANIRQLKKVPQGVYELTKLRVLNLDCNALTQFPGELAQLPKLKNLSLASNSITCTELVPIVSPAMLQSGYQHLPFQGFLGLTTLNLEQNRLTSVPAWVCRLYSIPAAIYPYACSNSLPIHVARWWAQGMHMLNACLTLEFYTYTARVDLADSPFEASQSSR